MTDTKETNQPKFSIGQTVWISHLALNNSEGTKITDISIGHKGFVYNGKGRWYGIGIPEDQVYATRKESIAADLAHRRDQLRVLQTKLNEMVAQVTELENLSTELMEKNKDD